MPNGRNTIGNINQRTLCKDQMRRSLMKTTKLKPMTTYNCSSLDEFPDRNDELSE